MDSKFPGLDSYIMEKKVSDIENSIKNSLIDNTENNTEKKTSNNIQPFYIAVTILILGGLGLTIYACVKLLT